MPAPVPRDRMRILLGFLAALGAVIAARAALRGIDAVEVEGLSMAPSLIPGDRLLVESWTYARRAPLPGEVVVAGDPRDGRRELVKRVAALHDGLVDLRGDLPAVSTDSRQFGHVPAASVRWRAVLRYWPRNRFGRIPAGPMPLELEPLGGEPACAAFGEPRGRGGGGRRRVGLAVGRLNGPRSAPLPPLRSHPATGWLKRRLNRVGGLLPGRISHRLAGKGPSSCEGFGLSVRIPRRAAAECNSSVLSEHREREARASATLTRAGVR
jgi:nickel-type superoxide dismutase maturation protease